MTDSGINGFEKATIGGGCFWCVEAVFEGMEGVRSVISGYAGGTTENPTYEEVCSGNTGQAEVVQITFDPGKITYQDILRLFFRAHDPTTPNRQGADRGTQYRSIILYDSEAQEKTARETIFGLTESGQFNAPIVTEVVPLKKFYPAEDYHQDYFAKNPFNAYCQAVIRPKLEKLKKK
ncbi:MAG: peptide-methionine (S)-S-oxide reductase MsrA [Spirochaetales bacterium]|nr:peptide-methionine (S)-S-oxide reductase MsrA [Spirochaetales bacterium]